MSAKDDKAVYLQNREISWLKFNERVLDEAAYAPYPLFERLKFIAIFTANLDEFYMVRVGALTDYMLFDPDHADGKTGMNAREQLEAVYGAVKALYVRRDEMYASLRGLLSECGVTHYSIDDLSDAERKELRRFFHRDILPLLSPQIVDATHPFPHLANKQLHIAVRLAGKHREMYGLIPVSAALTRVLPVRGDGFLLVEDLILHCSDEVFNMYRIPERNIIAVTRNADLNFEDYEEEIEDYRRYIKNAIKKRLRLSPVRLEFQYEPGSEFSAFFAKKLDMPCPQLLRSSSPLDFSFCEAVLRLFPRLSDLRAAPHTPFESIPEYADMFSLIRRRDILLSYPYESISPFLALIRQAAAGESVVSIKITLYRIDVHSKLAHALIQAAENGKDVVVIMELRARFDEDNNIQWAERLEQAGCKVIYGLPGHKVHCKVCLITGIENGTVHHITQIGSGNYNEKTAKQYTDLSLMTANREIGGDAAKLFKNLLVGNLRDIYRHLLVAPSTLKTGILRHIDAELAKAASGLPASIVMKCNSLTDRGIIDRLAEASRAGVRIRLIVRGICCLVPGVPGHTENISVTCIIGAFLEHSRIYCFGEGADACVYISSADLMTRNTADRVEVACPVLDEAIRARIRNMLDLMLRDNVKAWEQQPDGRYTRKRADASREAAAEPVHAQAYLATKSKTRQYEDAALRHPAEASGDAEAAPRGAIGALVRAARERARKFREYLVGP
ncbi:MAG: polyphosphate kinase 1 [Clostridiales Family XIII bacterium]|jgi:polyphosphate kinase|nr:polyphosphate kinase 1 [Clostridiales Family XIII bacterium]